MKNFNSLTLLSVSLILGLSACKKNKGDAPILSPQETVTMVTKELEAKPEVSTFTNAFKNVSLTTQEVAEGVTIFAPTNAAITGYDPAATVASGKAATISVDDSAKLTEAVLKDHIIKGNLKPADLTDGKTLVSVSGKEFKVIRKGDTIRVNGVLLTPPAAGTAMVYTVDKLLTKTKTTDLVNNPTPLCLLNKIIFDASDYSSIEYDSQNRPVKINDYDGTVLDSYITISYTSATQIIVKYYEDGTLDETVTYTISNGLAKSATGTYSYTESGYTYTVNGLQTFKHNADGFVTMVTWQSTTTTNKPNTPAVTNRDSTAFTYQNGNIVSEVSKGADGTYTSTYEYYTDKLNSLPIDSDADELDFLFTKPNKNPIKKQTNTSTWSGGSNSSIANYTYEFNSAGLITKKTEVYSSAGLPSETNAQSFQYSCK